MRALLLSFCVAACLGGAFIVAAGEPVSFQEVEESLTCQCGCGLTVHSCNHVTCDSALPLRAEIRSLIDRGDSKEQIIKAFSDKYGEKILSSPTTSGFNLLAWVMPFVVVGVAILLVLLVVNKWGRGSRRPPSAPKGPTRARSANEEIMERELKSFDA